MRRNIALVIAALAFAAFAFSAVGSAVADTADEPLAVYSPVDSFGELAISGEPTAPYVIWGEDATGGYAVIAEGSLDTSGAALLWVEPVGPTDGSPQFVIAVGGDAGGVLAIDDPGHEWWLD